MNRPDRDPFELLPGLIDPEPDPGVMRATIAASREAFLRRQQGGRTVGPGWHERLADWLRSRRNWMAPVAAGAFAAALAVAILPGPLMTPERPDAVGDGEQVADLPAPAVPPDTALSRGRDADSEAVAEPLPAPTGPIRMGAQPAPDAPPPDRDLADLSPMQIVHGDGDLRLGYRFVADRLDLFLLDEAAGGRQIDSIPVPPGASGRPGEAFILRRDGAEILVVQTELGDDTAWHAYEVTDGSIGRNEALSARIADASDRREVEARLAE